MNKNRRLQIYNCRQKIDDIKTNLKQILMEEEFAYDSMPEGLQGSSRGEESEESIELIDSAIDHLDEASDLLQEIEI